MSAHYFYILENTYNKQLSMNITKNIYQVVKACLPEFKLLYYEYFSNRQFAKLKEIEIRFNSRSKQLFLISCFNPEWKDLKNQLLI